MIIPSYKLVYAFVAWVNDGEMIGKSLDIVGNDRETIDILGYIGIYLDILGYIRICTLWQTLT